MRGYIEVLFLFAWLRLLFLFNKLINTFVPMSSFTFVHHLWENIVSSYRFFYIHSMFCFNCGLIKKIVKYCFRDLTVIHRLYWPYIVSKNIFESENDIPGLFGWNRIIVTTHTLINQVHSEIFSWIYILAVCHLQN